MTQSCRQSGSCQCSAQGAQPLDDTELPGQRREEKLDTFHLDNLDCADCASKLETKLAVLPGVVSVKVDYGTAKMNVLHVTATNKIMARVREAGYGIRIAGQAATAGSIPFWRYPRLVLTVLSGLFLVSGFVCAILDVSGAFTGALFLAAIASGGFYVGKSALDSIKTFTMDINVLLSIAIIGAISIGEWSEGAMAVFLFSLGNLLQAYSVEKSRQSIRQLMELSPQTGMVIKDGRETELAVADIRIGDLMLVKPGERIALDGKVISGSSTVNQAPITGESMPVPKSAGSEVFAGTLNENSVLQVEVTSPVQNTILARIVNMVEEAQAQRAPAQHFVDVFARYYTPAIIVGALAVAIVPTVFGGLPFKPWLEKALILLVVACPCALVISTPVAIVSAIGGAARRGVLFKGGLYLEEAGKVKALAFDKTGTLTEGNPGVTDIIPVNGHTDRELITVAAALDSHTQHPLAKAILRKADKMGIVRPPADSLQIMPGEGARALIGGREYYIGNARYMKKLGLGTGEMEDTLAELQDEGKTVMLVGDSSGLLGAIAVTDRVRPQSAAAINSLRAAGIKRIIMLTGDNPKTAGKMARQVGVDDYRAALLPADKLESIKEFQSRYGKVAMVGDGINDAPALAAAGIGIAMGKTGTDTALETADIALMADDLGKLPYIIKLSRRAIKIIKQNIAFSLLIKLVFILATFWGVTNLWMAVFADTGASLLVIANGMRLAFIKDEKLI
ncbi:MAG: cadmium-translocating P-type ATPase [Firmicutes bacterium]|nr:cadmium-translocating P-type ATPase [Bacillota bacterium]